MLREARLSLTPWKCKFKSDLAEKKQQLGKSNKLLQKKSKDLEGMNNQLEIDKLLWNCWKKKRKKSIHKTIEIATLKSEATYTANLQKNLSDCQQN